MNPLFPIASLFALLLAISSLAAAETSGITPGLPVTIIQQAVDRAHAKGGGVVVIPSGEYPLDRALDLSDKQNVTLLGEAGTIFKATAQKIARLTEDAAAGTMQVLLDRPLDISAGTRFEIHSAGRKVTPPAGEPYVVPYIMANADRCEGNVLHLSEPLKHPAPAGTQAIAVFNGIVVRGAAKNLILQNITVDMNRGAWPVEPKNHTYHCALIAQGPYSYEEGPSGPPVEGLRIVRCVIANAHQRGVAFYSVVNSGVYDCRIENTGAEGIDFDHFSYHCQAVGNTLVDCHNIELNDASHCLVAANRVTRPAVGVVVWQWCQLPGLNERNLLLGNEIVESRSDGILLRAGADFNLVRGNTILDSARIGISVEGESNVIAGNTVTGSKKADIQVQGETNVRLP